MARLAAVSVWFTDWSGEWVTEAELEWVRREITDVAVVTIEFSKRIAVVRGTNSDRGDTSVVTVDRNGAYPVDSCARKDVSVYDGDVPVYTVRTAQFTGCVSIRQTVIGVPTPSWFATFCDRKPAAGPVRRFPTVDGV